MARKPRLHVVTGGVYYVFDQYETTEKALAAGFRGRRHAEARAVSGWLAVQSHAATLGF